MRIFLAGTKGIIDKIKNKNVYILESFFYMTEDFAKNIKKFKGFLLDSGAFTIFGNGKKNINWENYVDKYAEFIKKHEIEYFFELDIDSVVGYEKVKKLRERLETKTQKKCIPVWHISRGIEEYKKLCENYKYIAIGCSGKHDSEWTRKYPEKVKNLVDFAKSKNVKVHGLGFTHLKELKKIGFFSVDSTTWLYGGTVHGYLHKFQNNTIKKIHYAGKRLINTEKTNINNFEEWIKFQQYAEIVL